MSAHALSRYLSRQTDKNGRVIFSHESIRDQCQKNANYLQNDGRKIRFYDGIALISDADTEQIVSVVVRKNPKKDWREVK